MAEDGFAWIYLIFFMIPLARILPRLVRKWRRKSAGTFTEEQINPNNPETIQKQESIDKPQSIEMIVLGEINRGVRDFSKIQKNLGINNKELETILNGLEDQRLMKVIKKEGMFGIKVELHITEKGFKKYYS